MSQCPYCQKTFADRGGVYQHAKAKHTKTRKGSTRDLSHLRPTHPDDDEESMAGRMINAQIQYAMGGPVDEDWLLDAIL